MIDLRLQKYALVALAAAALFGISTPLSKVLLGEVSPQGLAGLLYLGSGIGLLLVRSLLRGTAIELPAEAKLTRSDLPWLAGAIVCGGAIAPVLLLWGLRGSDAAAASLLLNFEGVLTTLVAAAFFREAIAMRVWVASLLIVAGGILLSWQPGATSGFSMRSLAIGGACLFWALDNNFTRKVSGGDPVVIALAKGLSAGSVNLALAAALGLRWPAPGVIAAALLLGFISYGVSLVLFIYALRNLGSARASAHFSSAPFIGAVVAVLVLHEPVTVPLIVAVVIMAGATWLVLGERHGHPHTHESLTHIHSHVHDAHHQHVHDGGPVDESHVHEHRHDPLSHSHPHLPDLHHRHRH
ncbi:MAG: EamA family transporter [Casimicrobiaceae bacterium]